MGKKLKGKQALETGPRNNETHGEISNYHIQNLRALLKGVDREFKAVIFKKNPRE